MKILTALFLIFFLLTIPVSAEESYSNLYEASEAEEMNDSLPDDTRKIFEKFGINPETGDWVQNLTPKGVFSHIFSLLTGDILTPVKIIGSVIAVIIITAIVPAFSDFSAGNQLIPTLSAVCILANPVWNSVYAAVEVVKAGSGFMLSFVPVFAGIVMASGAAVTSVSMSALLLSAAEAVGSIAAFVILPLMGAYLAMSISATVSPIGISDGFSEGIKRVAFWILSFISTVFVGILGIQTAVNSSADTLALKTGKFILGTAVPIGGAAVSEAVGTVSASVSLLRSSVGIYGIVALAVIFVPIILELFLWRAVILCANAVADQFSLTGVSRILKSVDMMFSLLVGTVLITASMFIISLAVVVGTVKTL